MTRPSAVYRLPIRDSGDRAAAILAVDVAEDVLLCLPKSIIGAEDRITKTTFDDLDTVVLSGEWAPDIILSPLLTPVFDALDLSRYLSQRLYKGRYLALVDRLPSADLIRREVAAQSPSVNFDVVVLDGSNPIHTV